MPEAWVLPLLLAGVFTAGGLLIQKLEQHAERISVVLGLVFLLVAMLDTLAVAERYADKHPGTASQATAYFLRPTAEQLARLGADLNVIN